MASMLELFRVGEILYSAYPLKNSADVRNIEAARLARSVPVQTLSQGDLLDLGGGLSLEVVHPPAEGRFSSNNASLVLRLVRDGKGLALLCGDAEIPALRRIVREGRDIRAEVLVIPHHGSAQSLWAEFYDTTAPSLALISNGAYNSFDFPKQEVLDALAERGIDTLTTASEGEMRVTWTRSGQRFLETYRTQ